MKPIALPVVLLALSAAFASAVAKLPAPGDEAKAKAAEAAAKTAWAGKVDGYLLCKSQDRVAAAYHKQAAKAPAAAASVPACADPGPFVYTLPGAASAPTAAVAAASALAKKQP